MPEKLSTKIFDDYEFSDAEKVLVDESNTAVTAKMNQSRVTSELILSKTIQKQAEALIKSNTDLAASNEKYSARLVWLTGALVFVGLVQIVVQIVQITSQKT
jgi:hypothetical protein